jgi:DNA-binding IclR family transcriptional regulator
MPTAASTLPWLAASPAATSNHAAVPAAGLFTTFWCNSRDALAPRVRGYAAPVPRTVAAASRAPGPADPAADHPAADAEEAAATGPADGAAGTQRIQAVDRAVALLKSVAASATPPTVLELARERGLNRSTAWRLLRTLEHHGLVDRDPITQRYTVGYGAISVAAAVTDDALVRRVRPLLTKLAVATGESVTLAVARRFNLVYVDQVDPPNLMVPNWLDKPLPLHATSGGKAFLAWLGPDERDAVLPRELARYTAHTITDRGELERECAEVRRLGYALCAREYEEFSSGASAAVLNSRRYPIAVINVWGPAPRNPARRLHEIGRAAVQTAEEVRELLD